MGPSRSSAESGVVAGEYNDCVVRDPGVLSAVDDLSDSVVHLCNQVCVHSQARRIGLVEVRVRLLWGMHMGESDIGEETACRPWRLA